MSYRKTRRKKTTEAFKREMFIKMLSTLNWKGSHMLWPYRWDGYDRFARIDGGKLFSIVEFDLVYEPPKEEPFLEMLEKIVDNGTTVITIPTPKGWKCPRKGCKADYMHTHGTYPTLKKK